MTSEPATVTVDAPPGEFALVAAHLSKRFGSRVAFDDVSFESGTARCSASSARTAPGRRRRCGRSARCSLRRRARRSLPDIPLTPENGEAIRARIAVMPESPGLYVRLTVAENLECFAGLYELVDPGARDRPRASRRSICPTAHATHAGRCPRVFASGSRWPARCSATPQCCFSTSPPSGLDPVAAREVHELIAALRQRGVTIFLTTHRLDEAERLCDRVAILNTTLRMIGRPEELREQLFAKTLCRSGLLAPARRSRRRLRRSARRRRAGARTAPAGYVARRV